jgi:hypothetical protein
MDGFGIRDAQDEPWPADNFSGRGLKLISASRGEAKLVPYQDPLHPSDEIWLLSRFLNEQWPHGGTLFAASTTFLSRRVRICANLRIAAGIQRCVAALR